MCVPDLTVPVARRSTQPPHPLGVLSHDDLAERLRALRDWSGLSYRDVHREVVRLRRDRGTAELPAYNTVYRCLQPGRRRMEVELVFDVATVLLGDRAAALGWRQAGQAVAGRASDASIVTVSDRLPDDLKQFVGRTAEVATLLGGDRRETASPRVLVLDGMAGVGKTRLAVHAGHRMVAQGAGGHIQLCVNLRGFDESHTQADPAAVLDGFLRLLDVPGSQIARLDLEHRATTFRQLMTSRPALVLLDNAASAEQVLPLLPSSPSSTVIVTSRHRLSGLPSAHHLTVRQFTPTETIELLRNTVGAARVNEELDAAASIAELVGHLPLALALLAGRIRATPDWTLVDHLERLAERRSEHRIEAGVETTLALSYDDLAPAQQRLLRLLALHPGRDVDAQACAALGEVDLGQAHRLLDDLLSASMLQTRQGDRFEMHDLVRAFAGCRCQDEEIPAARKAALTRLFDHYRQVAAAAMDAYAPHESHRRPRLVPTEHPVLQFADREGATRWLDSERANLMAAANYCADHGWTRHVGDLSAILFRYLDVGGYHHDALTLHGKASHVSEGTLRGHAFAHLSITCITLGRYAEALAHLEEATAAFRESGDQASESDGLNILAGLHWRLGRYKEAVISYERALALFRAADDTTAESHTLCALGIVHMLQGSYARATSVLELAFDLSARTGDTVAQCHTLTARAAVLARQGRWTMALPIADRALDLARRTGYRLGEADALVTLGAAYDHRGDPITGLPLLRQGLAIAREDGVRELELQGLNALGLALGRLGQPREAAKEHRAARALATDLGDRYELAGAHDGLGQALAVLGDAAQAKRNWRRALAGYRELGTPEAAEVAARLDEAGRHLGTNQHDRLAPSAGGVAVGGRGAGSLHVREDHPTVPESDKTALQDVE